MGVLILLALLGLAAAGPRTPQRIVGGSPTTVEDYPYMSNMQHLSSALIWSQWCGGSLITTVSVLSAVHCYLGDRPNQWRVRLGTSQASSGGAVHAVSQLILHSGYNESTLDNDIAVIRLSTPATLTHNVAPVSISGPNYNLADGTVVTTIGWGALVTSGSYPEQLQHVDINIINWEFCRDRYEYLNTQPDFESWSPPTDNMLCAGIQYVGGKDACQGDSGGPLVHKSGGTHVQVGIVSWGYECAHPDYPGVHTRVNRYTDWIVANA